jgi:phage protein D
MHTEFWWGSLKRPLGRPGYKLGNNIKMDLKKTEYKGVEWIIMV